MHMAIRCCALLSLLIPAVSFSMGNSALDPTFGELVPFGSGARSGVYEFPIASDVFHVAGMSLDDNGRILTLGLTDSAMPSVQYVSRHLGSDGSLDDTFGVAGFSFPSTFRGYAGNYSKIAADHQSSEHPPGILIAGGFDLPWGCVDSFVPELDYAALTRFAGDGSLDAAFGLPSSLAGNALAYWGSCDSTFRHGSNASAIAVDSANRITISGTAWNASDIPGVAMSRFLSDGKPDESFGLHGQVLTFPSAGRLFGDGLAVDPSGGVVVAGIYSDKAATSVGIALLRYNSAGLVDTNFGISGLAVLEEYSPNFCGIAIDSRGRVLIAAMTSSRHALIARFTAEGRLDEEFGKNGEVLLILASELDAVAGIVVDTHDQPLVALSLIDLGGFAAAIVHLNPDGSLNASVGEGGIYELPAVLDSVNPTSIILDGFGRPVISADVSDYGQNFGIIFRYDELFGSGFD